jgi:serine/threonine protein phosphatase PrpC
MKAACREFTQPVWWEPMSQTRWKAAARSDVGMRRNNNEDSMFVDSDAGFFVVADGMGGHAAGEVASKIAVETVSGRLGELPADSSDDAVRASMRSAIVEAGQIIYTQARDNPEQAGMGTTVTALVLSNDGRYVVGHIGDSRAYRLRGGSLERLTRDHSLVQEQLDQGLLTTERARGHPLCHILTRALGTVKHVSPDVYSGAYEVGDIYLLASDGLTDMLSEEDIGDILADADSLEAGVEALVASANDAGGNDNITAVAAEILS